MIDVGIIGSSGYTGGELIRLLVNHKYTNIEICTSRKFAGQKVSDVHKHLKGFINLEFEDISPRDLKNRCDVIFLAVPHGTSMNIVPDLLDEYTKVIDLSADYRINSQTFENLYGIEHSDKRKVVYGLPEIHPEVSEKNLVANPGCYSTGAILSASPLANSGLIDSIIFDSKSGITGAGVNPTQTSHYPNMAENVQPYKLTSHRHYAEMFQELSMMDESLININFTPHVIPSIRGILTTAHIFTNRQVSTEEVKSIYAEYYKDNPFVRIIDGIPSLSTVRGSNFCDIGFEIDVNNNRVVVVSAIDNLVKGAAGQAIQNMNLMCGFNETEGIWFSGITP
ncbi:N-acetyl-gamma-glutamyl-phosphate reductase [Methanohalobium evestigatum Z-7303]|uniref:N-acetyl-gamma-glutamyl-phosphate reductase n=1 Tax=Methanohalobium evestigatum (strain ATCC BAA-1072 / DSM 3721 / NBRC 107634 / OCM 161 / Z-7303) TaxID=644295 RepID=D7E8P0_METEZ|nr:N-acetyl-gamma-glutamyl-phosphate reductase [Methanohalobium evestigatum]ADI73711.1 N-acetyl-gamma-glutamyl-phosphate reductase [Methanohalobium evestigatum Z-7303]